MKTIKTLATTVVTLIRLVSIIAFFVIAYAITEAALNCLFASIYFIFTQILLPALFWKTISKEDVEEFDGELRISVADEEGTIWRLSIPDETAKVIEEKDILVIKIVK